MNNKQLQEIGILALRKAYHVHESLGVAGEQEVTKNQHGDMAMKVDVECEKTIIDFLRSENIPIKIISEEHGTTTIGNNPIYTAILDGLDGSGVYKRARGVGRYGTMFAIYAGLNPIYDDYIFCGAMEHSVNHLYFATKGEGAYVISSDKKNRISCNPKTKLDKDGLIYIDEYFEINKKTFSESLLGYNTVCSGSSCIHCADVSSGKADMALECTRKGNLEIAVACGLIKESGGVMITLDGEKLDNKKYLEFGQTEKIPVITAANMELATDLLKYLNR